MNTIMTSDRASLPDGWTTKRIDGKTYFFTGDGKKVCGAYNPKRRTYCKKYVYGKNNRCYLHGGNRSYPKFIDRFINNVRV